jgi:hypothetical protein
MTESRTDTPKALHCHLYSRPEQNTVLGALLLSSLVVFMFTQTSVWRTVPITITAAHPSSTDEAFTFIPANRAAIILTRNYFK